MRNLFKIILKTLEITFVTLVATIILVTNTYAEEEETVLQEENVVEVAESSTPSEENLIESEFKEEIQQNVENILNSEEEIQQKVDNILNSEVENPLLNSQEEASQPQISQEEIKKEENVDSGLSNNMLLGALQAQGNNYTITFDDNDATSGSAPTSITEKANNDVTIPATDLVCTGFSFAGWSTNNDGTGTYYADKGTIAKGAYKNGDSITLYARWAATITPTLTNVTADGSNVSVVYKNGSAILKFSANTGYALPSSVSVTGATGSWDQSKGELTISNPTGPISFTIDGIDNTTYTITPSLSNVTADGSNATSIAKNGSITLKYTANTGYALPSSVTVTGATGSWNKATGELTISNPTGPISFSITATEAAGYTITPTLSNVTGGSNASFIENGGEVILTYTADEGYILPDEVAVTGATGSWDKEKGQLTLSNPTGNVSFSITGIAVYKISYDSNGATDGTAPSETVVIQGNEGTISDNTNSLVKTGYTFNGWNTQANGTGDHYNVGHTFALSENLVLYAEWAYTITYKANNGSQDETVFENVVTSQEVIDNTFTNGSKEFTGWNTQADGLGTDYEVGATIDGQITLYAQWSITIKYNKNDGSDDVYEQAGKKQESFTLLDNTTINFTRDGYQFMGWGYTATSTTPVETINTNTRRQVYAIWAKLSTLTYHENVDQEDTSVLENIPEVENYKINRDSIEGFTNGQKTFAGWGTSPDSIYPVVYIDTRTVHDLYAIWQNPKEYVANFYTYSEYDETGGVLITDATPIFSVAQIEEPQANNPILVNVNYSQINSDFNLFDENGKFVVTFLQIKGQHTTSELTPNAQGNLEVGKNDIKGENIIDILIDLRGPYLIMYYDSNGEEIKKLRTVVDPSLVPGSIDLKTEDEINAVINRDGFGFDGWYSEPEYQNKYESASFTVADENIPKKYYIKWAPIPGEEVEGNIDTIPFNVEDTEIKETISSSNVSTPTVTEMEEILRRADNADLTKEYEELGETIDIWVEVTSTDMNSEGAKTILEKFKNVEADNYIIFDANLFIGHYDGGVGIQIHEPGCSIQVTLIMSSEEVEKVVKDGANKEYWIYSSHETNNGLVYYDIKVDSITKIDDNNYEIKFTTDRFSTFALYAKEKRGFSIPTTGVDAISTAAIDAYQSTSFASYIQQIFALLCSLIYSIYCDVVSKIRCFKKNK